jgi:hypothetical protein
MKKAGSPDNPGLMGGPPELEVTSGSQKRYSFYAKSSIAITAYR